ncbi:hypothetical protein AAC387_Pa04g1831 [Persea americana]
MRTGAVMPKIPTMATLRRVHRKLCSRFSRAEFQSFMNLFLFTSIPPPMTALNLFYLLPCLVNNETLSLSGASQSLQNQTQTQKDVAVLHGNVDGFLSQEEINGFKGV